MTHERLRKPSPYLLIPSLSLTFSLTLSHILLLCGYTPLCTLQVDLLSPVRIDSVDNVGRDRANQVRIHVDWLRGTHRLYSLHSPSFALISLISLILL